MMDKELEKYNKEIKKLLNKHKKLSKQIEQKQFEQYKYLKNKQLFIEISKLQEYKLLQESNIFVYFVNHRKIMNKVHNELIKNHEFNEYIFSSGRAQCDHLRCIYKFRFNDKNLYIHGNGDGYWCCEDCYNCRKNC